MMTLSCCTRLLIQTPQRTTKWPLLISEGLRLREGRDVPGAKQPVNIRLRL